MLASIESGYVQHEIEKAAYEYQKAIESGSRVVVGVNRFQVESEKSIPILRIDPAMEKAQVERLKKVRSERSRPAVEAALAAVEGAARSGENLMPHIIQAACSYATLGEISDVLRKVFGEYSDAGT